MAKARKTTRKTPTSKIPEKKGGSGSGNGSSPPIPASRPRLFQADIMAPPAGSTTAMQFGKRQIGIVSAKIPPVVGDVVLLRTKKHGDYVGRIYWPARGYIAIIESGSPMDPRENIFSKREVESVAVVLELRWQLLSGPEFKEWSRFGTDPKCPKNVRYPNEQEQRIDGHIYADRAWDHFKQTGEAHPRFPLQPNAREKIEQAAADLKRAKMAKGGAA